MAQTLRSLCSFHTESAVAAEQNQDNLSSVVLMPQIGANLRAADDTLVSRVTEMTPTDC